MESTPRAHLRRDLIADCVHCGFCLPACPTYVSWGDEMDSPRGRIDLMKGLNEGVIALDAGRRGTSMRAWAAWRASPRVPRACATIC